MEPHQERVVNEQRELDEKLVKLYAFSQSEMFSKLDAAERDRLVKQAGIMEQYSAVLGERIAAF